MLKKLNFLQYFLVPRPPNFEAKLTKKRPQADQNSSKNLVSILIPFLMDFGTNLGRFWEAFGGQLGAMLAPSAIKTRPQNQSKKRVLFGRPPDRFWVDFGPQHAPQEGAKTLIFGIIFPSWGHLGVKRVPRPPKSRHDRFLINFSSNFYGFLVHSGIQLRVF